MAVLPIASTRGGRTPCSDYLADLISAALLSHSIRVVDRQSFKAVLDEIDLTSTFEAPAAKLNIIPADVIVVGRYSLVDGRLNMHLKAVDVRSNSLLLTRLLWFVPDVLTRHLAFSSDFPTMGSEPVRVHEVGDGIRITASFTEAGANQLRLLDRARQVIRRTLADYLRDALGCNLSPDDVERVYRRGTEVDCMFRGHSVNLEMEFGGIQCRSEYEEPK